MYDDILVPTDGSAGTSDVLAHATAIAADNDATVHTLFVVDRRVFLAAPAESKDEVMASLEADGEDALASVREAVEAAGLRCETRLAEGIPHKQITDYVDETGIDLVVMGTHGHTGPERVARMGSTTERVLDGAAVPVLVVRLPGD